MKHSREPLRRWIAATCLLLVLAFAGMEAVHVHADRGLSSHAGTSCLICISAHANAPSVVIQPLPMLFTVAIMAIPYEVTGQSITARLELFTRPPPA